LALFKIKKGLSENLPNTYNEGYAYFTTDDGKFYIDTSNQASGRVKLNAGTAEKLETARTIELAGDVDGSASFDGSTNININASLNKKIFYDKGLSIIRNNEIPGAGINIISHINYSQDEESALAPDGTKIRDIGGFATISAYRVTNKNLLTLPNWTTNGTKIKYINNGDGSFDVSMTEVPTSSAYLGGSLSPLSVGVLP
jgi:hypothetical protein